MQILMYLRKPMHLLAALVMLCLSACSMQFISDYDEESIAKMLDVAKQVDAFYLNLADVPTEARHYQASAAHYNQILVELNALKLSQEVRQLNELTVQQVDIAISLWQQDISAHRESDGISDFILNRHRQQFHRIFRSMILGERAKATSNNA